MLATGLGICDQLSQSLTSDPTTWSSGLRNPAWANSPTQGPSGENTSGPPPVHRSRASWVLTSSSSAPVPTY
jgi:hypothetical protein